VGKGTIVTLYVPFTLEEVLEETAEEQPVPAIPNACHGRILAMDDEDFIRDLLQGMLSLLGYSVTVCRNGSEAVDHYRKAAESGSPYDAVILDLTIPGGMGGKEAGESILSLYPDARLIVSSGYSEASIISNPGKFGFHGVLSKPYRIEDLGNVLRKTILQ
jgi:CheY-like chemotaxis protein